MPVDISFTTHVGCWACFGSVMVGFSSLCGSMLVGTGRAVGVMGRLPGLLIRQKQIITPSNS